MLINEKGLQSAFVLKLKVLTSLKYKLRVLM